jgi:hypothetical protein
MPEGSRKTRGSLSGGMSASTAANEVRSELRGDEDV